MYGLHSRQSIQVSMESAYINWSDFQKVEIRTGTINRAEKAEGVIKPAYRLWIDFGPELGVKKTSAQLTAFYQPETLIGKQIVAVVNFLPKQIGTFMSECLVLGAVNADGQVTLLVTEKSCHNGERIG
jgi:tRNA-binding protein